MIDRRFVLIVLAVALAFPLIMRMIPTPPPTWAQIWNVKDPVVAQYGEEAEPRHARFLAKR